MIPRVSRLPSPMAAGLLVMLIGCSTGPPAQEALTRGSDAVTAGVDRGVEAVEDREVLEIRTRYNPCRCSAPDFEARLRGRWQRIVLVGDDQLLDELRTEATTTEDDPGLYFFELQGEFSGTSRYGDSPVEYEQFEVAEFRAVGYGESSR